MDIFIEKDKKKIKKKFRGTVDKLLESIDINPETVIVTRDDEILTGDDTLEDRDSIKILSVVSGG